MEKYRKIFCETFEIEDNMLDDLIYQGINEWDSVGHMALISALEDEFGIMMDMEDIIEFSSFKIGIDILKKYGVEF